jgi:undecaprenyl-diphosphatase
LAQTPETSFPSDHATLLFALALALVLNPVTRQLGGVMLVLAVAVAWSRVYLGVHFPLDMAGALLVALAATLAVGQTARPLQTSLYPGLERLYDGALSRLGLPSAVSPP